MRLKTIIWLTVFSVAMGYLESAVVVYLREIMYPHGFAFPLAPINQKIAFTELFREAATIIMLLGAGIVVGKTFAERFAWFIYCFAVWDIFYYIFLKLILNWPESLMTWDILFLIPVTWVGPVLAPIIVSFTMITIALVILRLNNKVLIRINAKEFGLFLLGSIFLIMAFIWDYSRFILNNYTFSEIWSMPDNKPLYDLSIQYVPQSFNWFLFIIGEAILFSGVILLYYRINKQIRSGGLLIK